MITKFNYSKLIFDAENSDDSNINQSEDQNNKPGGHDNKPSGDNNDAKSDSKSEKKYTDEDLDKIIEKKFAKWQKQKDAEINEAKKLADMNATERAEHERDKLKAELDELKAANTRAEMEKTARGILQADGVSVSDDIISHLVASDADTTSKNVKSFAKAFKSAVQAEVKNQLSHKTPASGTSGSSLTKEAIMKETNAAKRQQMIRENMSLFRK